MVRFDYDPELIARIKEIPGRRWRPRERCWSIPDQGAALALLVSRFHDQDLVLEERVERRLPKTGLEQFRWTRLDREDAEVSDACRASLRRMHTELVLCGYSPRTRKCYIDRIERFLASAATRPSELDAPRVREYLRVLLEDRGVSPSYVDQNISAMKFLFARVLGRPLRDLDLPRPKRQKKLPSVLSRTEVLSLLEAVENRKHLAILMLVYAAGLRVGEVVRLQPTDVDSDRGMLHIRQGKGRRDRYVPLSQVAREALRRYLRLNPTSGRWLFPGQRPGRHLSERSVQHVFARAKERAGIKKPASVHTLRHSYATHLHEGGIGLRYIQTLLGHRSLKTTEIYTHVSKADLDKIQSPLDQIMGLDASGDD